MSQYERTKRWKEKNRDRVNENQRSYRTGEGRSAYKDALDRRWARTKAWYDEYKAKLACSKCGENHPACIEFHHIDPSTKKDTITRMVHRNHSIETVLAEIAKCQVLCRNCHAKEHWNQRRQGD